MLATAISNQSGVSARLAIGFALMQHGAMRMLARLAPADRHELGELEAEIPAIVVGLAEEAARSHKTRAREPGDGASDVGGGVGLLDEQQTTAAAEAMLVSYLDRLVSIFDRELLAPTGSAEALAGGSGPARAALRETNVPEPDEPGALAAGRKRKSDPPGAHSAARAPHSRPPAACCRLTTAPACASATIPS